MNIMICISIAEDIRPKLLNDVNSFIHEAKSDPNESNISFVGEYYKKGLEHFNELKNHGDNIKMI
jgi:hypothetical protein